MARRPMQLSVGGHQRRTSKVVFEYAVRCTRTSIRRRAVTVRVFLDKTKMYWP